MTGPEAYTNHASPAPIYSDTRKRADHRADLSFNHIVVHPDLDTSYNQRPSTNLSR